MDYYILMIMKKVIVFLGVLLALAFSRNYPLYKQCDAKWKNDIIGTNGNMCKVGCLVSSVAMALKGSGHNYDPKTLNNWLKKNGGFQGNLFVWGSVNKLGLKFEGKVGRAQVKAKLDQGKVVILNVRKGAHWVLATGHSGDTINVNDPGYKKSSYALSEVSEAGVFKP